MAGESLLAILPEVVCTINKDLIIQRLGSEVFPCTALELPKGIVKCKHTGRVKSDSRH